LNIEHAPPDRSEPLSDLFFFTHPHSAPGDGHDLSFVTLTVADKEGLAIVIVKAKHGQTGATGK
jgi:hypothetical protein